MKEVLRLSAVRGRASNVDIVCLAKRNCGLTFKLLGLFCAREFGCCRNFFVVVLVGKL